MRSLLACRDSHEKGSIRMRQRQYFVVHLNFRSRPHDLHVVDLHSSPYSSEKPDVVSAMNRGRAYYLLILVLLQACHIPIAISALLPISTLTPVALANNSFILPPSGGNTTSLQRRLLKLVFTYLGSSIPSQEVQFTLDAADKAIEDSVVRTPNHPVTGGRFQFQRHNGEMLVAVLANIGEQILWEELSRVLEFLYSFMCGSPSIPDTHYQALNFQIETINDFGIGFGLVWYLPDDATGIQKRHNVPASFLPDDEFPLKSPNSSNGTGLLRPPLASDDDPTWHIPGSEITLTFTYRGAAIPMEEAQVALQAARQSIQLIVRTIPSQSIGDIFQFETASSSVAIRVIPYDEKTITYFELDQILGGLSGYFEVESARVLVFEIDEEQEGRVGFGTVLYHRDDRSAKRQLGEKNTTAKGTGLELPAPSTFMSTTNTSQLATTTSFPVPDSPITLDLHDPGAEIPASGFNMMILDAREKISATVDRYPDEPITNGWFNSRICYGRIQNYISVNIVSYYDYNLLTWHELDDVLYGISDYGQGDIGAGRAPHFNELFFEIMMMGRKIGQGTVLLTRSSTSVAKRASIDLGSSLYSPNSTDLISNTTTPPPNSTAISTVPFVPMYEYKIPGSPYVLNIEIYALSIPTERFRQFLVDAFVAVNRTADIDPYVLVPDNEWHYQDPVLGSLIVAVKGFRWYQIKYGEVAWIMKGLGQWVGEQERSERSVEMRFEVDVRPGTRAWRLGSGVVTYGATDQVADMKR